MSDITSKILENLRTEIRERFDGVDKRFESVDERFAGVDKRFDGIDKRFDALERTVETLVSGVQAITAELGIIGRALLRLSGPVERVIDRHEQELQDLRDRVTRLETAR